MANRIAVASAPVLMALLFLVACGDDDDTASAGRTVAGNGAAISDSGPGSDSENGSSGPDSSGDEGGTGTIAMADFIRKGNAICQGAYKEISRKALPLLGNAPKSERPALEAKLVETVMVPALRNEVEQLRGLGTPPGDEQQVGAIVNAISDLVAQMEADPKEVSERSDPFAKSAALAERYGLGSCPYT